MRVFAIEQPSADFINVCHADLPLVLEVPLEGSGRSAAKGVKWHSVGEAFPGIIALRPSRDHA